MSFRIGRTFISDRHIARRLRAEGADGQCGAWDSRYLRADSLPGFSTTDR